MDTGTPAGIVPAYGSGINPYGLPAAPQQTRGWPKPFGTTVRFPCTTDFISNTHGPANPNWSYLPQSEAAVLLSLGCMLPSSCLSEASYGVFKILNKAGKGAVKRRYILVMPRLGYGWLSSAFDGSRAVAKYGEPSRHQAAGFGRLWLDFGLSHGFNTKMEVRVHFIRLLVKKPRTM